MSKLKTPKAKKKASLEHDRRNAYGENNKASRKNVPRAKARTERAYRRAVHQALAHPDELNQGGGVPAIETELAEARAQRKNGFKKTPDIPLGDLLEQKQKRRARAAK